MLRYNTIQRFPVILTDTSGLKKTGVVPADLSDGTVDGQITVIKNAAAPGDVETVVLSAGVNWFEVDATAAPGLYHILLPATATAQVGPVQVSILPAVGTTTVLPVIFSTFVENITATLATMLQHTEGRWKIHTSGPDANRLVIYDIDGVTALKKFNLLDASGTGTTVNPYERVPV